MENRRILGLDPGTQIMGYGLIEGDPPKVLAWGTFIAPHRPLGERLLFIYKGLEELLDKHSPDEAAVEEPFVAKNPRSAIAVGQAQALAFLACAGRGIPVHSYPPTQVKGAVAGYGRGEKEQVQEMVRLQLGLEETPGPDAADALAVALCHLYHSRRQELIGER
jgi:crossover junction endodeoxyribonuclease RuvC